MKKSERHREFLKYPAVILFLFICIAASAVSADIRISINADGIYLLTYTDLQNAGLGPSTVDPRTIKIFNQGNEVPISVSGEADGIFDATDYIEFYGTAIARGEAQFEFTTTNIYWLSGGGANGLRMSVTDGTPSGSAPVPASFNTTAHTEDDTFYWQPLPEGEGRDHWFWGNKIIAPANVNYTVSLNNISAESDSAVVRVSLQGRTAQTVNPDHHTKIYLNNTLIDSKYWDGQIQFLHEVTVPHSYLVNGTNTIKLEAVSDAGSSAEIYMDWVEINYYDTFAAENGSLDFQKGEPGTYEYRITGFPAGTVEIFDISYPDSVKRVINNVTQLSGSTYTTRFEDDVTQPVRYLALTTSQRKPPAGITADTTSDIKNASNGADFIIITYDDFYSNILPLATFYQNRGLRVKVVKMTDIYDEFSYGISDPQAVKSFLQYAYLNWAAPAPLYVLLVGDANIDYKDNFKKGNKNFVPTHLFEMTSLGQTPTDNWFVSVSGGDILPDMFIGRISAQTAVQVDGVVSKITGYYSAPPGAWNKTVQFVADDADDNGPSSPFEPVQDELATGLPSGYTANKVYLRQYGSVSSAKTAIKNNFNSGTLITSYVGHGSVDNWAGENMFVTSDVTALNNAGKLSFVVSFDCLNGFFPLPLTPYAPTEDQTSLAEQFLLLAGKGAIAAFAPTGLGYETDHEVIARELFSAIFTDGNTLFGSSTTQAKISAFSQTVSDDVVEIFELFGDPAAGLKFDNYLLAASWSGTGSGTVTSAPAGLNCGTDCTENYAAGTVVTLTASPASDSGFTGWSGDPDCYDGVVTMDAGKNCTATFTLSNRPPVINSFLPTNVTPSVNEGGSLLFSATASDPDDGDVLSYSWLRDGTQVSTVGGYIYYPWYSDSGLHTIDVTVSDGRGGKVSRHWDVTVNNIAYTLTVNSAGTGSGMITSNPAGINCAACSASYDSGTLVTLSASPADGSVFAGWSGNPDCSDGSVAVNSGKTCTATFNLIQYRLTTVVTPAGAGYISPDCSGGCLFGSGTTVVITAVDDQGRPFTGWTGCDSASSNICTMTMDADKGLTAVFDPCLYPVRIIADATSYYYYSLQDAYDAAENGDTIQSRNVAFTEDMYLDRSISFTLQGGYDCNYSVVSGRTSLVGNMIINDGAPIIENLSLE